MSWKKALGIALVACSMLVLVACGSGGGDDDGVASLGGVSTETETTTTTASDDPEEVLLDYTECMRDEGIDIPDPEFSADGRGGRIQLGPGGIDPDDPDFQAAQKKCEPLLESLRQNFDEEDRQAMQDAALEFAKCMREHGIDMPDPDFSEGGGAFRNSGIDPDDPDFQKAEKACEGAFEGIRGRIERRSG